MIDGACHQAHRPYPLRGPSVNSRRGRFLCRGPYIPVSRFLAGAVHWACRTGTCAVKNASSTHSLQTGELAEGIFCTLSVCRSGFFDFIEVSKAAIPAVDGDHGPVLHSVFCPHPDVNSLDPGLAILENFAICVVERLGGRSKIVPSVVHGIGIPMVNLAFRVFAGHVIPCEFGAEELLTVDANSPVRNCRPGAPLVGIRSGCPASDGTSLAAVAIAPPIENTGVRIVAKKFEQAFMCDHEPRG
jgi:hypothetical protein